VVGGSFKGAIKVGGWVCRGRACGRRGVVGGYWVLTDMDYFLAGGDEVAQDVGKGLGQMWGEVTLLVGNRVVGWGSRGDMGRQRWWLGGGLGREDGDDWWVVWIWCGFVGVVLVGVGDKRGIGCEVEGVWGGIWRRLLSLGMQWSRFVFGLRGEGWNGIG